LSARQSAAESVLGPVNWENAELGYCKCPGEDLHNSPTSSNHCRVNLDGIPTIFCFHTSCGNAVEAANHRLRSDIWKLENGGASGGEKWTPTPVDLEKMKKKQEIERRKQRAIESLPYILEKFHVEPADIWEESPVRLLDDPKDDWRLLLALFHEDDVVWIGDKTSSCNDDADEHRKAVCRQFFRPAKDWLLCESAPGNFTCPSTFIPGTYSRSNKNVVARKFLVIESDSLSKTDMLSVIQWCRTFMRLRAIVDTAGKSLHGWFDAVPPEIEAKLRVILPNLGKPPESEENTLDPALFKIAQPCRLPGALRDGKYQNLYYLDVR
jgi:hypothetical protein